MQFQATSHEVSVEVRPAYLKEPSNPIANYYMFSYQVRITNLGLKPVQLRTRHWIITDAFGKVEEVKGDGVIGQQPWIKPGETFEYSSFCPLPTPTGSMKGTYTMVDREAQTLEVTIPSFILSEPNHFH